MDEIDRRLSSLSTQLRADDSIARDELDRRARKVRARRRTTRGGVAAIAAAVVVAVGVVSVRNRDQSHELRVVTPSATTTTIDPGTSGDCTLPPLPVAGSQHSDLGLDLSGPAVDDLKGGAALASLSLDDGMFAMTPPHAGDTPTVTAEQAECAALASSTADNYSLLNFAANDGGAAVGYGRVSVAPELAAEMEKPEYGISGDGVVHGTNPTLPAPPEYHDRLAWMVVVRNVLIFNGGGPEGPAGSGANATSTTESAAQAGYGYAIFLVDARTGSDALIYTESQPGGIAPAVSVPADHISVPWTLTSRSPNGYTGEISATVLPCDGYPDPVLVDHDHPGVAVVVLRPVGASCGAPKQVTLVLHAATVTSNIPDALAHDPLGPYVTLPNPADVTPPGATGGVLSLLSERDNGTTIHISVGSVLAVSPLHEGKQYDALHPVSSDPTVLGVFGGSQQSDESGEFRAWTAGHADLSVPDGSWVVHVDIK